MLLAGVRVHEGPSKSHSGGSWESEEHVHKHLEINVFTIDHVLKWTISLKVWFKTPA